MLPKALYGTADWKAALRRARPWTRASRRWWRAACRRRGLLLRGHPGLARPVGSGAGGDARGQAEVLAWMHGRRALKRAFTGRLRYGLDGGDKRRTEALVLISP